jgi:prophage regulatory protein
MKTMDITVSPTLLRLPQVMKATGLARSTVYKLVAARSFPVPVRITGRSVAWHAMEVQTWIGERSRAK